MPIDPAMLDATLGTFRTMAKEINDKGISSEVVDKMNATLARMETLGQEMSDYTDFSGKMMNENLYGQFSDYYGKALAAEAQSSQDENGYDDATLLKQTVDALKDAIKRIEDGKKDAIAEANTIRVVEGTEMFKGMLDRGNAGIGMTVKQFNKFEKLSGVNLDKEAENIQAEQEGNLSKYSNAHEIDVDFKTELLTEPLQNLINLGEEPGMTLPKFLTIQIEKGLDKAAQGTVTSLEGIKHTLGYANAQMLSRIDLEENEAKLALFQKMIDEAPFNVPNTKKYNLLRRKIEHEFAPQHEQWKAIKSRWEDIIDAIELWLIASTNVYQSYAPWLFMSDFNEKKKLAEYIMDCNPGFIKIKLENFKAYFDMSFEDIFKHETFVWEVENYHLDYSQEYLTFLTGPVFNECKPLAKVSSSITSHFENHFHKQNRMGNPEAVKAYNRIVDFYDDRYGNGRFEERHGATDFPFRNTGNWDLSTFNS